MGSTPEALVHAFVEAPEDRADDVLARLLVEHAGPVVDRVLRANLCAGPGRFAGHRDGAGASDLRAEALALVLSRLRVLRRDRGVPVIQDFHAYVAVVARNTVYEHLRRSRPGRERLRRRLWQLLSHDCRFGLWRGADGSWLCGAAGGQEGSFPAASGPGLLRHLEAAHPAEASAPDGPGEALASRLEALFARLGGPVAFGELLTLLAAEQESHRPRLAAPAERVEEIPDPGPDAASRLASKAALAALWQEIEDLPSRQCAALLLGLRDEQGRSALVLLPATGTASIRRIAGALDWDAERLAMLWNRLPLEDREIADLLGLGRQQVANLRKAARERLARRLARRGIDL
jgi:DNA-directed RNA polymerase specialized sigma24 family protein